MRIWTHLRRILFPWSGLLDVQGTPTAYLIRNSRFLPEYDPVTAREPIIAGRAVSSLIRTQCIGDTYRIAAITNRDGVDVQLTWVPLSAPPDPGGEVFDQDYMRNLFDYGYQRALRDKAWRAINIDSLTVLPVD